MTLGNMREQGVHHLIAVCLNDACRHVPHYALALHRFCPLPSRLH
jgi:hypothetical protein